MAKTYAEAEKRAAIAAYVVCGTLEGASRATGTPRQTIQGWRKKNPSWWDRIAAEVWELHEDEIRAGYREIVVNGIREIKDRVENGDTRINANGEAYRVPVSGRDMVIIVGTCQDKLNLSQGKPISISARAEQISTPDRLKELKQAGIDSGAVATGSNKVVNIED